MDAETEAKLAREVADMVAQIMRLLSDLTIEQKLGVLYELDRHISLEQGANRQQH
jgi:hypothetical protein